MKPQILFEYSRI